MIGAVGPKFGRPPSSPPSAPRSVNALGSWGPSSSPRSSGLFEVYSVDSGHCIGRYDSVLICIWRETPTLAALETVRRVFTGMIEMRPGGAGVLGVAQDGMPTMGTDERRATSTMFADVGRYAYYVATVVEGDGFWASTSRSVMTAISIVAHRPCPLRIFRQVNEAAEWQTRFPGAVAVPLLCDAVERCRALMDRR
jgi:hypothetical protein